MNLKDEHIVTHSSLETNTFIASGKHVYLWRRVRLAMETNVFRAGDERI